MNKIVIFLIGLLMSLQVLAFDVGVDCQGLTAGQCQQIALKANREANSAQSAAGLAVKEIKQSDVTPAKFQEWGQAAAAIGSALGDGLVTTATKLGVAANDFAKTPIGKFSLFLIFWTVAGASFGHVLWAVSFFLVSVSFLVVGFRRLLRPNCTVKIDYTGEKTWYGRPIMKTSVTSYNEPNIENKSWAIVGFSALMVVIMIITAIIMP